MFAVCISQVKLSFIRTMSILTRTTRFDPFSYRFAHITHTIRALQSSTKTSLRIEAEGLLSLQFLVPVPKARGGGTSDSFIEFRVCMAGISEDVLSRAFLVYGIGRRSCVSGPSRPCLRGAILALSKIMHKTLRYV